MPNKYESANRMLRARNIAYDSTVVGPPPYGLKTMTAPGTDITFLAADFVRQIMNKSDSEVNVNTNFRLRRVGVFCNFADGLVFKGPDDRLDVIIQAIGASARTTLTGAVQLTYGSVQVNGVGSQFQTDGVATGDILRIANRYYTVLSLDLVTPETVLYLTDYAKVTIGGAGAAVDKLTLDTAAIQTYTIEDMTEMNFLKDVEYFFNPAAYTTAATLTDLLIAADINGAAAAGIDSHDVSFYTDSIAVAFSGDNILFDVIGEFEFTP